MVKETNTAYLLSLIGGVLILVGSLTMFGCGIGACGIGFMGSMMSYMIGSFGLLGFFNYMSVIGIVSALIILYGAFMLKNKPNEGKTWGTLVLVFSLISLLSMGGFLVGSILGIIGGIFALS